MTQVEQIEQAILREDHRVTGYTSGRRESFNVPRVMKDITPLLRMTIDELVEKAYADSEAHGFWDAPPNIAEKLCLIHSEVSEALEEHRVGGLKTQFRDSKNHETPPSSTPIHGWKPEGIGSELADICIRVADLAAYLGLDLAKEIRQKMEFNATREYRHGKRY